MKREADNPYPPKTLLHEQWEFNAALWRLFDTFAEGLGLTRFVSWLNRRFQ